MHECVGEEVVSGRGNPAILKRLYAKMEAAGVPISASVELTERCNLRCVHCYLGEQENLRIKRAEELDGDWWRQVFDQLAELGIIKLVFTGGDPFLRKDFAELYRYVREKGFYVSIFTNGTLITPKWIELFRELPPSSIEISLYGSSEETYQRVTGTEGAHAACVKGIEMLKKASIPVGLKSVAMRENLEDFKEIANFCRVHSDFDFRWDTEIQGSFQQGSDPLQSRLSVEEAVDIEFSDEIRRGDWQQYFERRRGIAVNEPDRLFVCGALTGGVHINPYGHMQPCVTVRAVSEDLKARTVRDALGRLRERLFSMKAPQGYRCSSCNLRAVCSSCPGATLLEDGRMDGVPFYQCLITQARNDLVNQMKVSDGKGKAG